MAELDPRVAVTPPRRSRSEPVGQSRPGSESLGQDSCTASGPYRSHSLAARAPGPTPGAALGGPPRARHACDRGGKCWSAWRKTQTAGRRLRRPSSTLPQHSVRVLPSESFRPSPAVRVLPSESFRPSPSVRVLPSEFRHHHPARAHLAAVAGDVVVHAELDRLPRPGPARHGPWGQTTGGPARGGARHGLPAGASVPVTVTGSVRRLQAETAGACCSWRAAAICDAICSKAPGPPPRSARRRRAPPRMPPAACRALPTRVQAGPGRMLGTAAGRSVPPRVLAAVREARVLAVVRKRCASESRAWQARNRVLPVEGRPATSIDCKAACSRIRVGERERESGGGREGGRERGKA